MSLLHYGSRIVSDKCNCLNNHALSLPRRTSVENNLHHRIRNHHSVKSFMIRNGTTAHPIKGSAPCMSCDFAICHDFRTHHLAGTVGWKAAWNSHSVAGMLGLFMNMSREVHKRRQINSQVALPGVTTLSVKVLLCTL